jgi:hypothetical protein
VNRLPLNSAHVSCAFRPLDRKFEAITEPVGDTLHQVAKRVGVTCAQIVNAGNLGFLQSQECTELLAHGTKEQCCGLATPPTAPVTPMMGMAPMGKLLPVFFGENALVNADLVVLLCSLGSAMGMGMGMGMA